MIGEGRSYEGEMDSEMLCPGRNTESFYSCQSSSMEEDVVVRSRISRTSTSAHLPTSQTSSHCDSVRRMKRIKEKIKAEIITKLLGVMVAPSLTTAAAAVMLLPWDSLSPVKRYFSPLTESMISWKQIVDHYHHTCSEKKSRY